jgi:hypothetical protein
LATRAPERLLSYPPGPTQGLEAYPTFIMVHHLEELKVARRMQARSGAHLTVVQRGSRVALEEGLGGGTQEHLSPNCVGSLRRPHPYNRQAGDEAE